jgi:hypothetical protein
MHELNASMIAFVLLHGCGFAQSNRGTVAWQRPVRRVLFSIIDHILA